MLKTENINSSIRKPREILDALEVVLWGRLRWLADGALYEPPTKRTLQLLALVAEVRSRYVLHRRGSRQR